MSEVTTRKTFFMQTFPIEINLESVADPSLFKANLDPRDLDLYHKWVTTRLRLSPRSTETFTSCFEDYEAYVTDRFQAVPINKRSFCILLRYFLEQLESEGKVKLFTRSRVHVRGITLGVQPGN